MIILGPVEHDRRPFERVGIGRIGQIAIAESGRDDARLHDRRIEQIARQDDESRVLDQRPLERPDDLFVLDSRAAAIVADAPAIGGWRTLADQPLHHQLVDHRRNPARPIEVLAQILPGGLQVDEQRHLVADALPLLERKVDADVPRDRRQMDRRVGRSADRRIDDDGVVECVAGHDVRRLQILRHHLDDALAGAIRIFLPVAIGRGDSRRAG